ncbi:hypothetical protein CHS0354_003428 [Potamilus streckersoni]|uniref:Uncharacterized protein n=1 Tax=Potamilus streckersoni TaxID=2493646 RepID=A0AAE0SPW1_9BIVA|nr:hypothetical protein CHS0354_003428 [Potamilus streckersoni]
MTTSDLLFLVGDIPTSDIATLDGPVPPRPPPDTKITVYTPEASDASNYSKSLVLPICEVEKDKNRRRENLPKIICSVIPIVIGTQSQSVRIVRILRAED